MNIEFDHGINIREVAEIIKVKGHEVETIEKLLNDLIFSPISRKIEKCLRGVSNAEDTNGSETSTDSSSEPDSVSETSVETPADEESSASDSTESGGVNITL